MGLATGLEFAPGTTKDCQRLVAGLFSPGDLLGAYRMARQKFQTSDIVISVSQQEPSGFQASPRSQYLSELGRALGHLAPRTMRVLGVANNSAHAVVKVPADLDAFWLVVVRGPNEIPSMCVMYTTPYQVSVGGNATDESAFEEVVN